MNLVFLGLSLSSSWGNGHATTYRALLAALAARGHRITFLEREQSWYAANRDLEDPPYCDLRFYHSPDELKTFAAALRRADAVVIGSYVPDALKVTKQVMSLTAASVSARPIFAFYDIDTPVTLRKLADGDTEYLSADLIPQFDLYLSFTGGPTLRVLEEVYGARMARALYCSVDSALYKPVQAPRRWALGYLGTYSADRQPTLNRLLLQPARLRPDARFVVAGSQYPGDITWPENVDRIEHLPPAEHPDFYCSLDWTLNVTRADMVRAGYSPSVRLFEATACGTPVISDAWPGLEALFEPDRELLIAQDSDAVLRALATPETVRQKISQAARDRTLQQHTARQRAYELETYLRQAGAVCGPVSAEQGADA